MSKDEAIKQAIVAIETMKRQLSEEQKAGVMQEWGAFYQHKLDAQVEEIKSGLKKEFEDKLAQELERAKETAISGPLLRTAF
jgi:hypothetical protein